MDQERALDRADGCLGIPARVRLVSEEDARALVERCAEVRQMHAERKWFLVGVGAQETPPLVGHVQPAPVVRGERRG
jgi:hypothetical protein